MMLVLMALICLNVLVLFIVTYFLIFYKRKIESLLKGEDFSFVQLFWGANIYVLYWPYKFDNNYPDKQILQLSRKYDRLVPFYYFVVTFIMVLVGLLMISRYVPTR